MRFWSYLLVFMAGVGLAAGAAFGGDLEPAAPPGSTSGYTMDDLYNRLRYGTDVSPQTFTEPGPADGAISGSVRTVDEVMGVAPERDDVNGATSADVLEGKTFWGLTGEEWGPQTGAMPDIPARTSATGQTTSYATGDDGDLQMGAPLPSPRFTDNGDGTVTDNKTELIWLKNANCFGQRVWTTALNDCNTLTSGACGLSDGSVAGDWRLPNIRELKSLIHRGFYNPALSNASGANKWNEGDPFNNILPSYYWSGTTWSFGSAVNAFYVYLDDGNIHYSGKDNTNYVWPVRGGQ